MFDTRLYLCPGAIYAEVMSQVLNTSQNKMISCMYNVYVLRTSIYSSIDWENIQNPHFSSLARKYLRRRMFSGWNECEQFPRSSCLISLPRPDRMSVL